MNTSYLRCVSILNDLSISELKFKSLNKHLLVCKFVKINNKWSIRSKIITPNLNVLFEATTYLQSYKRVSHKDKINEEKLIQDLKTQAYIYIEILNLPALILTSMHKYPLTSPLPQCLALNNLLVDETKLKMENIYSPQKNQLDYITYTLF